MSFWTIAGNLCFVIGVAVGAAALVMLGWTVVDDFALRRRNRQDSRQQRVICTGCYGKFNRLVYYGDGRLCCDCHERQMELDSWTPGRRLEVQELDRIFGAKAEVGDE